MHTAVGELMATHRADQITIPMVADTAGVNPTSVYRRWGDIDGLLEEVAIAAFTRDDEQLPDTGDLGDDLRVWARGIAADIRRPQRTRYLKALAAARDGAVAECPCWTARRSQITELVGRARSRGQHAPGVEQVLDHVIAPLYHHVVFSMPTTDEYADRLVDDVLTMQPR